MKYSAFFIVFTLIFALLIQPTHAQTIIDIPYDDDILITLTDQNATVAYDMPLDTATTLDLSVRYLGAPFTMTLEIFDEAGVAIVTKPIDEADTVTVNVTAGANLLLLTADSGQTGRAVVRFSIGGSEQPPESSDGDDKKESSEDADPLSGDWRVTYGEASTNCPDDLPVDGAWLPADGSIHTLNFSTPPQALEFHAVVAPEEIADDPTFFETELLDDGSVVVIPGIQTAPYRYTYTVLSPNQIRLDYKETLALSDCVLTATILLDAITEGDEDTTTVDDMLSVEGWGVNINGDASTPIFYDDGRVCATDQQGGVTWYFAAPQDFVAQVVDGYGKTLSFELKQDTVGGQYDDFDIILVVGNGFFLVHDLPTNPNTDFTTYTVALDETGGWFVDIGDLDATDPDLFAQMLSDVTQVQIRGEYSTQSDTGCLRNPQIID